MVMKKLKTQQKILRMEPKSDFSSCQYNTSSWRALFYKSVYECFD